MELELFDHTAGQVTSAQQELVSDLLQFAAKKLALTDNTEMSLTFVNNPEIKELNSKYRNVDRATDVLSFAAEEAGDETPIIMDSELAAELPVSLGDLFVSIDKVNEQAKFLGHSINRELGFLVVHGFLHLDGYDHENPTDEKEMFDLQREILDGYGLTR
ncbi:rRNA maturation RNase YbeY [Limosilactobacillus sp. STM2_1]|uniref:Endoribonuclease YbeY n=1 Tax=Limosilactobacillus rudii TaxID=2759755 RepID=A0A7W3YMW6_9LACO|nr:rRNA maturation RNase YbeY [Limosilactobacillus rudii]MBB1078335.1 rRNA maturation RNase YbeY [Limosilactobacillus rudii]MBB1096931.1 rRNA maturation RNase YbeY [Limosilactobacillus rudii]MCD7134069.1 rRNA maturation RNase YbeY [Limosilactobacillus rudii]